MAGKFKKEGSDTKEQAEPVRVQVRANEAADALHDLLTASNADAARIVRGPEESARETKTASEAGGDRHPQASCGCDQTPAVDFLKWRDPDSNRGHHEIFS
jgi:hypothetical protein